MKSILLLSPPLAGASSIAKVLSALIAPESVVIADNATIEKINEHAADDAALVVWIMRTSDFIHDESATSDIVDQMRAESGLAVVMLDPVPAVRLRNARVKRTSISPDDGSPALCQAMQWFDHHGWGYHVISWGVYDHTPEIAAKIYCLVGPSL